MYVINIPVSQHKYPTIKVQWLVDRNIACRKNVVFQSVFGPEMYICRNSLYGGGASDKDCCLLWVTAGVNILPLKPRAKVLLVVREEFPFTDVIPNGTPKTFFKKLSI